MIHPPGTIIVNADDFGMSAEVNRAVIRCFRQRLISSTTIMANMPGFEEACAMVRQHSLSDHVGIHLNLTDGIPLLQSTRDNPVLCDSQGRFRRFRPRILSLRVRSAVEAEVHAQILRCRDSGLRLTHADSHQHVHNEPLVLPCVCSVLQEVGIRYLRITRNLDPLSLLSLKRFLKAGFNAFLSRYGLRGTRYLGTVEGLNQFRYSGRFGSGSVEILTHPTLNSAGVLFDHVEGMPLEFPLLRATQGLMLSSYSGVAISDALSRHAA